MLRSAARRACVLLSCRVGCVSWVARLAGWLAFRAVAPHFSHAVRYLELLLPVVACPVRFAVRRFKSR